MDIQELRQEKAGLLKDYDKLVRKIEVNGQTAEGERMLNCMETRIRVLESQLADEEKKLGVETEHARRAFHSRGGNGREYETDSALLRPDESYRAYLERRGVIKPGASQHEGLSMGECLEAYLFRPKTDRAKRALAEGVDSSGGFTVPIDTTSAWIDLLRPITVTMQAGAQIISLDTAQTVIAQLTKDVEFTVVPENNLIPDNKDPTFGGLIMQPKKLALIVRVPIELEEDSINLAQMLQASITNAARVELERLGLQGDPNASPAEPSGIVNTLGIHTVSGVGFPTDYAAILDGLEALWTSNTDANMVVMPPSVYRVYAGLVESTTGSALRPPPIIEKIPFWKQTTGAPAYKVVMGDFRQLYYGIRSEVRVERLSERYAEYGQRGFLSYMRVDVGLAHPEGFSVLTDVALS